MTRRYPPGTFVVVPQAATYDRRMTLPAHRVLQVLQDHANGHGELTFLSHERMAADLGIGRSTVKRALGLLEGCGYVRSIRRTKSGRGMTTNHYLVVFDEGPVGQSFDRPGQGAGRSNGEGRWVNSRGPVGHMVTHHDSDPGEPNPVHPDTRARAASQTAGRARVHEGGGGFEHDHEARSRSRVGSAPAPAPDHDHEQPLAGARHEHEAGQDHEGRAWKSDAERDEALFDVAANFRVRLAELGLSGQDIGAINDNVEASITALTNHFPASISPCVGAMRCALLQVVVEGLEGGPSLSFDERMTYAAVLTGIYAKGGPIDAGALLDRDDAAFDDDEPNYLGRALDMLERQLGKTGFGVVGLATQTLLALSNDKSLPRDNLLSTALRRVRDLHQQGAPEADQVEVVRDVLAGFGRTVDVPPPPPPKKGKANGHARPR